MKGKIFHSYRNDLFVYSAPSSSIPNFLIQALQIYQAHTTLLGNTILTGFSSQELFFFNLVDLFPSLDRNSLWHPNSIGVLGNTYNAIVWDLLTLPLDLAQASVGPHSESYFNSVNYTISRIPIDAQGSPGAPTPSDLIFYNRHIRLTLIDLVLAHESRVHAYLDQLNTSTIPEPVIGVTEYPGELGTIIEERRELLLAINAIFPTFNCDQYFLDYHRWYPAFGFFEKFAELDIFDIKKFE